MEVSSNSSFLLKISLSFLKASLPLCILINNGILLTALDTKSYAKHTPSCFFLISSQDEFQSVNVQNRFVKTFCNLFLGMVWSVREGIYQKSVYLISSFQSSQELTKKIKGNGYFYHIVFWCHNQNVTPFLVHLSQHGLTSVTQGPSGWRRCLDTHTSTCRGRKTIPSIILNTFL